MVPKKKDMLPLTTLLIKATNRIDHIQKVVRFHPLLLSPCIHRYIKVFHRSNILGVKASLTFVNFEFLPEGSFIGSLTFTECDNITL